MAKIGNLMIFNPKIMLLSFIRRFYNPKLDFADRQIKAWVDSLVKFIVDIVYNGFATYMGLAGLIFVFPRLNNWIYLGDKLWHFPFILILLGISSWFIRGIYVWFRIDYKTKEGFI